MRSKIKILRYGVTYATCGATLNVLTYLLKPMKNYKMMIYVLGIAPFVSETLPFSDLRTKELKIFLSTDTTENTKTTKNSKKTE